MAVKVKLMKMMQEFRGLASITARRPAPKQPGLFLMQWRAQAHASAHLRQKHTISIEVQHISEIPHPVKITHVRVAAHPQMARVGQ